MRSFGTLLACATLGRAAFAATGAEASINPLANA